MRRKIIVLVLLACLFINFLPVLAEDASGDWYGISEGLLIHLSLGENGTFMLSLSGQEDISGTWELNDGFVNLNTADKGTVILSLNDTILVQGDSGIILTREQEEYAPAEALKDAPFDLYSGYWKAAYADTAGTAVPAFALEDETDLYVEGHSAILGGPVLGDAIVKLVEQDGKLVTEEGVSPSAELVLQQDGLLRLIVTGSDTAPQTWYLLRSYSSILDSAEAEAETAE